MLVDQLYLLSMHFYQSGKHRLESNLFIGDQFICNPHQEAECTERTYRTELQRTDAAVAKLENQLDVVTKRWGATMADNAQLRAAIDHQLLERAHFNALWQRAGARLDQGKRYIGELIDQSTVAYEQREELCAKIQGLRERGLTDGSVHLQEMRELQRRLDHDAKLQQFFTCKGNRRQNAELERRADAKLQLERAAVQQQIDEYETLLARIRQLTGELLVDRLAECFRKQEEENFALFSYVNELNAEVETLQGAVGQVEQAIGRQRSENELKERAQLESAAVLLARLAERRLETARRRRIRANIEQKLSDLLAGVARIFELLRCDEAPVLELLDGDGGMAAATTAARRPPAIDIHNVQLFLGVVRRRAQLIISTVNMALLPNGVKVLARKDRVPKFNVKEAAHRAAEKR